MNAPRIVRNVLTGISMSCFILLANSNPAHGRAPGASPRATAARPVSRSVSRPVTRPATSRPVTRPRVTPATVTPSRHPIARPKVAVHAKRHIRPQVRVGVRPPIVVRPKLVVPKTVVVGTPRTTTTVIQPQTVAGTSRVLDLGVTDLRVEPAESATTSQAAACIVATLKNIGNLDYESEAGWQVLALYKDGLLIAEREFTDLAVGEEFKLVVEGEYDSGVYEARILFADTIREDGNPRNDDASRDNNSLSRYLPGTKAG